MAFSSPMNQASLGLHGVVGKKTRKRIFLDQMERVVPWGALVDLIAPYYPAGRNGRPPFALETMLRIHFMQQWFNLVGPRGGRSVDGYAAVPGVCGFTRVGPPA